MNFKLGLDLGVASVGWGIIDENYNIIDSGVRLFSEASAKENVKRREMRSSRRRVRRVRHRLDRMGILLSEILEIDLPEPFGNIYEIRCRGLKEKLKKEELFLALMHLTKRRGTFYLTADDIENKEDNGKSTEEILLEQEIKLKENYICEIQYKEFLEKGRVRGTENRFKNKEYLHELEALLNMQAQFYPVIAEYKDEIYKIYNSKREYFEGPGSEKSPTPYGSYRYDENGNVIKVNLIDLMRGKCTYFPDEKRIAKGAYTAALFNILNDLNNLKIKDRKITEEEKRNLIENYINKGKNITLNYIAKVTGVDVEEISGYRIDKSEKPIFTEFKQYKDILKVFDKFGDRKLVEGNALLCDDIAEVLTKEKSVDIRKSELEKRGIEKNIASEIAKLSGFTQYHSLSKKAINTIIGDLWSTGKNQMQLFHDCGLTEYKNRANLGEKIKFDGSEWIVSPITKRTVNEAVKVINACRKMLKQKYNTEFSDIVIEMAREKNLDEKKKMEKDIQKKNELRAKAIHELTSNRKLTPRQFEIINLLLDQDMRSAYSGKAVSLPQVYEGMLEVDHIIPRSISFDDSKNNKVAVFISENQKKAQRTPFMYLKSGEGEISYEKFKEMVLKNTRYSKSKKANLLLENGLPEKEMIGFINRNLVDTRYACRKVLKILQDYFKINNIDTKVKVIKGSATFAFRKKAKLDKNREESYAHHAQDALIIAGLFNTDLMKKLNCIVDLNEEFINDKENLIFENGKVINKNTGEFISDEDFNASKYIQFIKQVELRKQKYSHKVDRKPNRQLYDQQLKSTRTIIDEKGKEKTYVITKYKNIYAVGVGSTGDKLAERIRKNPESLLMYHNDPETFKKLLEVVNAYPDKKINPFAKYKEEYNQYITKYAKHNNGPIIMDVKFIDGQLGVHRVNKKQNGKNKSVYLQIKSLRADFYYVDGAYKFINVPYDMIYKENGIYKLDLEKYQAAKVQKGINGDAEFKFSLHRGEFFSYKKDKEEFWWQFSCVNSDTKNVIETKYIDKPSPGNTQKYRMITIGKKITDMCKYNVDVLGNIYPVDKEILKVEIEM